MGIKDYVPILLRIGVAFSFLYSGIAAFLNPEAWIGFIPFFLKEIISEGILTNIHSVFNILVGLWVLSGKKTFYASVVASIALFTIIIFNLGSLDIIFRDVAILFAAIALALMAYKK